MKIELHKRPPDAVVKGMAANTLAAGMAAITPKVIVAVHGIGDQIENATVQSAAFRLFDNYNLPPAIPIGRFHLATNAQQGVVLLENPPDPKIPGKVGFAEVYWANIPRKLVQEGFTLEEAKRWARTIVARLNVRASEDSSRMNARQYRMLETVLDELIDAVYIVDNLTFLADKAGLFKFSLKKVLDDYLNDVQVVTEFEGFREDILNRFDDVMTRIVQDKKAADAEIYIVGHSEGSVVAFFGLLRAMSRRPVPDWVKQVRGLMTIGSPIEVHLLLWAQLWRYQPQTPSPAQQPIVWWNYLDSGDPIAYALTKTREWLDKNPTWKKYFAYSAEQERVFSRYPLPGKAHVDYWNDKELFSHFFDNVVNLSRLPGTEGDPKAGVPRTRAWASIAANVMPYALVAALMFLAMYFIYTPVANALTSDGRSTLTPAATFANVLGLTLLMAGMTVGVRVPRIATSRLWWLGAAIVLLASLAVYPYVVHNVTRSLIDGALDSLRIPPVSFFGRRYTLPAIVLLATVVSSVWSYLKPARGVLPLLVPGVAVVALLVIRILINGSAQVALWPMLLGAAAFLYLWWLSTLLFDLTVVWHSYVRWATALDTMRKMIKTPEYAADVRAE